MLRFPLWKIAAVLIVTLAGVVFSLPNLFTAQSVNTWPSFMPNQQVSLGLDLQGGSHLLLEVDTDSVLKERLETLVDDVRVQLRSERIGYRNLGVVGDAVTLNLTDEAQKPAALEQIAEINQIPTQGLGGLGLNPFDGTGGANPFERMYTVTDSGVRLSMSFSETMKTSIISSTIEQSLEVVRRRIDEVGTREPVIQRQGQTQILVQVPGEKNPDRIKKLLGQTAKLNFHMVDVQASLADARAGRVPAGSMYLPAVEEEGGVGPTDYVVRSRVLVSGENLVDSQPSFDLNTPVVSFRFDQTGAREFGRATADNVGGLLAIVLDGQVISAPRIDEPILGGSGIIRGNFTVESARDLSILLRAGALPAPLDVVEERSVGPDLGADSVAAGKIAGILSIIAVGVFMILYYGSFGVAAVIGLMVNMVLIIAVLSMLQATLTLPGIAGIVLTVGMAVDANVLIFERIREEARAGRSAFPAIDVGYQQALRTIIDANVTTLIAAIILFQFGSGPIKGFAVTLAIGIVTSMFTAVTLTRLLVVSYMRRKKSGAPLPLMG